MATPAQLIDHIGRMAHMDYALTFADVSAYQSYDASGASYADDTTDANDDGANDATMPDPFDSGDYFVVGYANRFNRIRINVGTAGAGDAVVAETTWEYYNGAGWSTLTVSDATTSLTVSGVGDVTFTPPADWATTTLNSLGPYYYVRMRATANDVYNTTQPLLTRIGVVSASEERTLILGWLQNYLTQLCQDLRIRVPADTTVSLTAGQSVYTLDSSPFPTDMVGVRDVMLTDGSVTLEPVDSVTMPEMRRLRAGSTANSTPLCYAVDWPQFYLYPAPSTGSTIYLSYLQDAPTLSDGTTAITVIPDAYQRGCLLDLALSDAYRYKGDEGRAVAHESRAYNPQRPGSVPRLSSWLAESGGRQLPAASQLGMVVSSPSQDLGPWS